MIHKGEIIQNGDVNYAEGIKYDFTLGNKFLKAYFGKVMDYEKDLQTAEDKRKAVVEPGEVVFGLRNVAGTPFDLIPGTKIVGANFFELNEDEIIETYKKPLTIDDFPEKLLLLIQKYKPVNPQNLAEELNKLQHAFDISQTRLGDNVKELKEKVDNMSQALILESTKREQENSTLKEKFATVENKLEHIERENIRNTEKLDSMKGKVDTIDETTKELNKNIVNINAVLGIKGKIGTVIGTFLVTVIAGLIVAYFQGWLF